MHKYFAIYIHFVFTTKNREPFLTKPIRNQLFPSMVGMGENYGIVIIACGGIEDHVHILTSIPTSITIGKAAQCLKGGSSYWLNQNFAQTLGGHFNWQRGYGAFTIGQSQIQATKSYIFNQETHHKKVSTMQEWQSICQKHDLNT